jgi:hypothetical protein
MILLPSLADDLLFILVMNALSFLFYLSVPVFIFVPFLNQDQNIMTKFNTNKMELLNMCRQRIREASISKPWLKC